VSSAGLPPDFCRRRGGGGVSFAVSGRRHVVHSPLLDVPLSSFDLIVFFIGPLKESGWSPNFGFVVDP